MRTIYKSPTDSLKLEFLDEFRCDLERIGNKVAIKVLDDFIEFDFTPRSFPTKEKDLRAEMIALYDKIRTANLADEKDFLVKMEEDGILDQLADGKDIDISKIKPEIRICNTRAEKNIYRYYRQSQKVPNSSGVGRRFSALVYDIGQTRDVLMGVIGLAGTAYSIEDRDKFLEWSHIDSKAKIVKHAGLRRIMELSICMAIPPYNFLYGGKLMAILSLSNPIQAEFQKRYPDDMLLALITTGATGNHAPIFNRIRLNQITPVDIYNSYNNEMFKHIGATSESTTIMLTDKTIELARRIAEGSFPKMPNKQTSGFHSGFNKMNAINKILRLCNVSRDVLKLIKKSIYIGYLSENNLDLLKVGKQKNAVIALGVDDALGYWKSVWLQKAIADENRMKQFIQHKRKQEALSQLL